jgi:hypothetical protein
MRDQGGAKMPDTNDNRQPGRTKIIEMYELFRSYVKHEDTLIDHRTTWLIYIQSFLLATFGFSYQKKFEVYANACSGRNATDLVKAGCNAADQLRQTMGKLPHQYNVFLLVMCIVGVGVSIASWVSIRAAVSALSSLDEKWEKNAFDEAERAQLAFLPFITGGAHPRAAWLGKLLPQLLPAFFTILWVLAIAWARRALRS